MFGCVLEAGTAGGKLAGILPGFTVNAMLVEKGYTKDGAHHTEQGDDVSERVKDRRLG